MTLPDVKRQLTQLTSNSLKDLYKHIVMAFMASLFVGLLLFLLFGVSLASKTVRPPCADEVIGAASNYQDPPADTVDTSRSLHPEQEILSHLLLDHDLLREDGEAPKTLSQFRTVDVT